VTDSICDTCDAREGEENLCHCDEEWAVVQTKGK
jgi:hypothetical protein